MFSLSQLVMYGDSGISAFIWSYGDQVLLMPLAVILEEHFEQTNA